MASVTHSRCPYALAPISGLAKTNREHIFPDAVGGVLDYAVTVDEKKNSELGTLIDAPLIHSPLIAAMRMIHGIKSRSGPAKWKLSGRVKGTTKEVNVTFSADAPCEVRIRRPVDINPAGDGGTVTIQREDAEEFQRKLVEGYAKKGKTVRFEQEVSLGSDIELDLAPDQMAIKRAMAKIGYAATYEYLGDSYLDDPISSEWRKAIFATTAKEAQSARIHGLAFDAAQSLNMMVPPLQSFEHAVAIANFPRLGIITAVTLFGTGFHHLVAVASESSTYALCEGEGKIAICDAKAGKTRFMSFTDHLVQLAGSIRW